jgi:Nif-specific regulatory protein
MSANSPNHVSSATILAGEILSTLNQADDQQKWLRGCLGRVAIDLTADYVALAAAQEGAWTVMAETTGRRSLPVELLADVADAGGARTAGPWAAAPLPTSAAQAGQSLACVAHFAAPVAANAASCLAEWSVILGESLIALTTRQKQEQRIRRMEAILKIAGQWKQTLEIEPLLLQMAEAATKLLDCDRASLFLWEKTSHLLIGRPALGVPGGELRVPDDRGVVGQVLQSGLSRRVDDTAEPTAINHFVDTQTGYRTKTLLCVPLAGSSGERFGVFELINKRSGNFTSDDEQALAELASHAAVALENAQDRQKLLTTNRQIADQAAERVRLIGESPAMEALRSIVKRVAETDLAVLITGENGTGKEVVAQSIHYQSKRRGQPLVAVNCAAIPDTLAESELFGHEKGAFTDAREARPGKFELAHGGTLFLDEIGDLSLPGQAKLLRVLEEKVLVRVGGSLPITVDVRVLAATNQNLADMVRQKKFREDLYFRLNVVSIEIPALRNRPADIVPLAEHFLTDFSQRARRKHLELTAAAKKRLLEHSWSGNVRELRNLMERLAFLAPADRIEADELAFILSPRAPTSGVEDTGRTLADATSDYQIEYIRRVSAQCSGNMSRAAERLGLHRSNLYRKMRQLGMEIPEGA